MQTIYPPPPPLFRANPKSLCLQGPTLTMRIHTYSLMRDVIASQLRPRQPDSLWKTSPLVVMNNFSGQEHLKLASVLFQNLFPAINVQTAQLASCQVCKFVFWECYWLCR